MSLSDSGGMILSFLSITPSAVYRSAHSMVLANRTVAVAVYHWQTTIALIFTTSDAVSLVVTRL